MYQTDDMMFAEEVLEKLRILKTQVDKVIKCLTNLHVLGDTSPLPVTVESDVKAFMSFPPSKRDEIIREMMKLYEGVRKVLAQKKISQCFIDDLIYYVEAMDRINRGQGKCSHTVIEHGLKFKTSLVNVRNLLRSLEI